MRNFRFLQCKKVPLLSGPPSAKSCINYCFPCDFDRMLTIFNCKIRLKCTLLRSLNSEIHVIALAEIDLQIIRLSKELLKYTRQKGQLLVTPASSLIFYLLPTYLSSILVFLPFIPLSSTDSSSIGLRCGRWARFLGPARPAISLSRPGPARPAILLQ